MQNVRRINPQPQSIVAASDLGRDAPDSIGMATAPRATSFIASHVRVYRFILRIVRDTTMAEDLVTRCSWSRRHGRSSRPLAVSTWLVDRPLQGADLVRQRRFEESIRKTCARSRRGRQPETFWNAPPPARSCAACVAKLAPAHVRSSTRLLSNEKVSGRGRQIIGISAEPG